MQTIRQVLLALLLTGLSLQAQVPTVSNVTYDGLSHSVVRLKFAASAKFYWLRIRFTVSPATCTAGTGGLVQGTNFSNTVNGSLHQGDGNTVVLAGLDANTTYQACPEISLDGQNFSTGAGVTFTTQPLPAIHPALPIPPKTFDTSYPDTTGYSIVNTADDCSDFMAILNGAVANQMTTGTVINLPAGKTCTNAPYSVTQRAPDVTVFPSSSVDTTQNTIAVANHGFNEGDGIIFGSNYGCLPGSSTGGNCLISGPVIAGQLYYVHVVDMNTMQIYNSAPKNSGGTLCQFSDSGGGTMYYVHWPRPLKWVIVRTSTPDSQFAPVNTRVNPTWKPKMANLELQPQYMFGVLNQNILMSLSDIDGHIMNMTANIRFVGVEFSYADNPATRTTSDPYAWAPMIRVNNFNQSIVFDRCWFHNPGTPSRVFTAIYWDGKNSAIKDSYLDGLEFFKSMYNGLTLTKVN